jgi:hypothetical protein
LQGKRRPHNYPFDYLSTNMGNILVRVSQWQHNVEFDNVIDCRWVLGTILILSLKYIIIPPPYVFLSNPLNGLELKPGITKLLVGTRWSKWVSVKHQNPQQYVQCHQFCFSNFLYWGDIYTNLKLETLKLFISLKAPHRDWWLTCTSCVPLRRPRILLNIPGQ